MSFDDLTNQTATIYRKSSVRGTNADAMPNSANDVLVASCQCRFKRLSARQADMWGSLGIFAEYEIITKYGSAQNGDTAVIVDQFGRNYGTFRLVGGAYPYVGEGSIQTFFNYPCNRASTTGLTS